MRIDVTRDYTLDTKGFWDDFWEGNPLGQINKDPDNMSLSLMMDQMRLYSRKLPNGEFFDLNRDFNKRFLWKGIQFSSDSIINNLRHKGYTIVENMVNRPDYRKKVEDYLHEGYTIGGEIIWPVKDSINQARGCNRTISDRMDLTLYCIQAYYQKTKTLPEPGLNTFLDCIKRNGWFFDLFVDFKGYVDFFFLNDMVEDYDTVLWINYTGRPSTEKDYNLFCDRMMDFLRKRNKRISEFEI